MTQTRAELLADSFGTFATGAIPIGGIIMWSGSIASIPTGWSLCNGTNGTPNLRDRFVVGAGSGYAVAATGGSADAVVVSHKHSITDPGHEHTFSSNNSDSGEGNTLNDRSNLSNTRTLISSKEETGIEETDLEGVDGANKNLPPYYALAFIMRVS